MTFEFNGWPNITIGHLFYAMSSFVHYFKAISEFKLELQSGNTQFGSKSANFWPCVNLKFDGWPWKIIEHLFSTTSSFVHHFTAIWELKLVLQSGNAQFGSKSVICCPCDLEIWRMTSKNNRAPPLCYFNLCASFGSKLVIFLSHVTFKFDGWPWKTIGHLFYATLSFVHSHWWIQTRVTVRKRPNWGQIFYLCDLDLWHMNDLNAATDLYQIDLKQRRSRPSDRKSRAPGADRPRPQREFARAPLAASNSTDTTAFTTGYIACTVHRSLNIVLQTTWLCTQT